MNETSSASSLDELSETPAEPETTTPVDESSRWWYWIAAYPVYSLLAIPLALLAVVLFASVGAATAPAGPDPQVVGPAMFGVVALVVGLSAIYALLGLVLTLLLPVALYLDATELTESTVAWSPDPILYGLVGLLNFLAAPVVGIIVALYYLYRRHEHVGTP